MENQDFGISPGTWEVSYGEIWSGGDLAIMAVADPDPKVSTAARIVATLVSYEDEATPEDVANAELIAHAPAMLDIIRFLADGSSSVDSLREDAQQILRELAGEVTA